MKELKCKMCGGTDLVKDGDYYVCRSCGEKINASEFEDDVRETNSANAKKTAGEKPVITVRDKKDLLKWLIARIVGHGLVLLFVFIPVGSGNSVLSLRGAAAVIIFLISTALSALPVIFNRLFGEVRLLYLPFLKVDDSTITLDFGILCFLVVLISVLSNRIINFFGFLYILVCIAAIVIDIIVWRKIVRLKKKTYTKKSKDGLTSVFKK